jgi:YggT family protein
MFDNISNYLLNLVFSLFGAALLLRAWGQAVQLPPYNPISRAVFQVTDWLVLRLRRLLPSNARVDWASLAGAWLTALLMLILAATLEGGNPAVLLPFGLLIATLIVCKWALNLLFWLILLFSVLSWVNPRSEIMWVLAQLINPFLAPIKRFLPAGGVIDFSPLILLVMVQIVLMVLGGVMMNLGL